MIVKVCGMREADNIRAVIEAGADMIGLIFYPKSPRYVPMISSGTGIVPDHPSESYDGGHTVERQQHRHVPFVGVFVDDMPQNIVTRVYNYDLDYVQLHGCESRVMIENLRHSIVPDIRRELKIIKTISVASKDDFGKCAEYEGVVDLFLFDTVCSGYGGSGRQFDWDILSAYEGDTPFLLSGGISPDDADAIRRIKHPKMIGVDINSRFETAPAVKDATLVQKFIRAIKG